MGGYIREKVMGGIVSPTSAPEASQGIIGKAARQVAGAALVQAKRPAASAGLNGVKPAGLAAKSLLG